MAHRTDHIRSFAVRQGRISKGQQRAIRDLSDRYCLLNTKCHIDVKAIFGDKDVVLEIGFGMGHATAEIAKSFPEKRFIGVEVYPAGVGRLLAQLENQSIGNVRIIRDDAVDALESMIPKDCLSGVHIFFPDPWPKKRHHKRRLITREFLGLLVSRMKPSGYLYMVTDWIEYAEWMLTEVSYVPELRNEFTTYAKPLAWRPKTKFEQKGLSKGHEIREIYLTKR